MRMRRKKHFESRLEACKDYLIPTACEKLNEVEVANDTAYIDYEHIFGNNNKVVLEIGCGMGQFVCENAILHPDTNFIAIEKVTNVIITACERAIKENLRNVKFINTNAACLPRYIKPNTIQKIYLNFSNPLPSKSDAKQRLTYERFLIIYKNLLVSKGEIYQKTDDKTFFEYSMEQYQKCGFELKNISLDLHNSGIVGDIVTEHEKKFSDQGLPIYRVEAYLKD